MCAETLCATAGKLAADRDPLEALVGWLREYVSYHGTKHALIDGLNRGSDSFRTCLDALRAAGAPAGSRPGRDHHTLGAAAPDQ